MAPARADGLTARRIGAQLRPALVSLVLLTLITGALFPYVLLKLGTALFPDQAAGGLVTRGGVVVGARLIGQDFQRADYFQPRPSAAGAGYDGLSSGGTNYGPANPKLIADIAALASAYRARNDLAPDTVIPIDAVTRSGSGLDPEISPANAALQVARVARARRVSAAQVTALVAQATQGRQWGFLGEPRVSVLQLNLALDRARN